MFSHHNANKTRFHFLYTNSKGFKVMPSNLFVDHITFIAILRVISNNLLSNWAVRIRKEVFTAFDLVTVFSGNLSQI